MERIDGTATLSYELLASGLGPTPTWPARATASGSPARSSCSARRCPSPRSGRHPRRQRGGDRRGDGRGRRRELPGFLVGRASDLLDLRYAVPALPFGLRLTSVTPAEDGVSSAWRRPTPWSAAEEYPCPAGRLRQGMSGTGAVVLVAALVLTGAAAWWLRARNGAVRVDVAETTRPVFARLGVRPGRTPTSPSSSSPPRSARRAGRRRRGWSSCRRPAPASRWSRSTRRATSTRCANSTSGAPPRCSTWAATAP